VLPDVITIHDAPLETAHVQSRLVAIVSVPDAPDGGADCIELVTFTWHLLPDGPLRATDDEVHALASIAAIAPADARAHAEWRVRENC
jgi:hypothetical protein